MLGKTLTHYQILEKLGEGGMGVVYKARDTRLNRLVALKVLPPERMADPARRARFIQEAQAASALNHPNIVTIYEIDSDGGTDFIAMELIAGRTLDAAIGRQGLKLGETLKCAVQIADALAAAHAAGIVHRDLKPGNVMLAGSEGQPGQVKVLDFGLAKLAEPADSSDAPTQTLQPEPPLTERGAVLGTVAYMSPEQAEGKKIDARSDIFAFGSLLYEMVTGRRAFSGDSKMSTITAILRDEPRPVSEAAAPAPRDLEKIIARCLRKDPARRFQHMDDVKIALEELKEESESGRLLEAERPAAVPHRSPLLYVALGSVLLLLIAVVFLWRFQRPSGGHGLSLRQLTQDAGYTGMPAISPDGKLVAYASDRAGDAGLDIWVQQLTRGAQPIRLTRDKADEMWPSFSPDGGQIVFYSAREGGGIYVMPALGGEERLLLRGQLTRPRFSPDGQFVVANTWGAFQNALLVISSSGGPPRQLVKEFHWAGGGVWSPDGKRILFMGEQEQGAQFDWWVTPLDGGPPVRTGAVAVLASAGAGPAPVPGAGVGAGGPAADEWLGDSVLFSNGNLWRVDISPQTSKVSNPERLTTSSGFQTQARAVAAGKGGAWRIVFANSARSTNLWSLAISHNAAKPLAAPVKLIPDGVSRMTPSLSDDSSRLVYVLQGLEGFSIRVRDVRTGTEKTLMQSPGLMRARISPDGTTVAYNLHLNDETETTIFLISSSGGDSRKLCDTCGLLYYWTPDGKKLVHRTGRPMRFFTVDLAAGASTLILADPKHQIHAAVYSPDMRWIAMHYAPNDGPRAIFLAPARDGKAAPPSEWIAIMDRPGVQTRPWWSPDGNVLYFLSSAGGQLDIWAQRLNPKTKRPVGEPVVIYHPQAERLALQTGPQFGPALSRDQLIFPITETSGNVWVAE